MSSIVAGAARASIAPRPDDLAEGVWLGGFGSYRQRRATGVRDDPQCRALALADGDSALVIAVLDLVGASGPWLAATRADAARLTGVPAERIILACTHSHASPDLQGLWGGVPSTYAEHAAQRAAGAVFEAVSAMTTANVRAASLPFEGAVRNRRGWPETDPTLTAVSLSAPSGAPIATIANYACHPTAGGATNTEVSRDWCGFAVDAIERESGGVAIYLNAALGDVNPSHDGFEAAESLGEAVAAATLRATDKAGAVSGALRAELRVLEIPLNFERLSQRVQDAVGRAGPALSVLARSGGLHGASLALHTAGRSDLAQIVAALQGISERRLAHRGGRTYLTTQCGVVRLGDIEALCAPGEVLTRMAMPLRASMGTPHRMIIGLANDALGYFVPEDEWMTGRNNNYEESVSMGKHAGTALADALLSLVAQTQEPA